MSPIVLHLLGCHVPLIGGCFMAGLLVRGLRRPENLLLGVADIGIVVVALSSALAWATGPAALQELEPWMNPASNAFADRHSSLADFAMVAWALAALLAVWGIILRRARTRAPAWRLAVLFGLVVVALGLTAWTGHEGGRIRHEELRHGAQPISVGQYE